MSNFQIHELNSLAVNRNSNIIHDTEVSTDEWDTGKDIAGAVADLASANVAAPYDETVTYAIGQYCLYEGNIYRCIAITTGVFDSTAWVQIVVTGEFRRVVELLSAQYSALSSAEKNNGTIYIKTDEETTADDIPYSAGVSVADKLDSLTNVSQITAITTDSTGITDNDSLVVRVGNLLILNLSFTLSTSYSAQWKDIFSFDDTTLQIQSLTGFLGVVSTEANDNTYGQLYLNTNTNKVTYRVRSGVQNKTYRGQLVVPISNSV